MTVRRKLVPLMQFVPRVSPRFHEPLHLRPVVDLFERIGRGEQVHAAASAPPRHEKTETIAHGVAWLLKQNPAMRICYASYGADLAEKKSRRIRSLAERAHVPLDPTAHAVHDWRTGVEEGGVWATSVQGAVVGEGFDGIVLDDAIKDRTAAESSLLRERLYEWFTDTLYPRLEPGGSIIVLGHRWHPDDLIGRLTGEGWEWINLPALDANGNALCPQRFTAAQLIAIREKIGEYAWHSLYQGVPIARGGSLFGDVRFYDDVPEGCRIVVGVDLNYVAKTRADYSVAVICAVARDGTFYVLDVVRRQTTAPSFAAYLAGIVERFPGASLASYVSGVEQGSLDFMARQGVHITPLVARVDKFNRAQLTIAAWNAGRIKVPHEAPWLDAFVDEIVSFTGVNDRHDDQVDALVSACDAKLPPVGDIRMLTALQALQRNGGVEGHAARLGLGLRDLADFDTMQALVRGAWRGR